MDGITVGLVSSVLGILCGIIAVIGGIVNSIKKEKNELQIRQSIIDNKVDYDTAKLLVTPKEKRKNRYRALMWGFTLLCTGLACVVATLSGIKSEDDVFPFVLIAGLGCGLLVGSYCKYLLLQKSKVDKLPEE